MKRKIVMVMNVALVLVAMVLVLNLFGVTLPSLGRAGYLLDEREPLCVVNWKESYLEMELDPCCLEARKQLECQDAENVAGWDVEKVCFTGSGLKYYLNDKAFNYCKMQVIW